MTLVIGLILVTACVAETRPPPDACGAAAATVEARLADAGLEPSRFDVCRGQVVTLTLASERDGVIHIHGYDEQAAEVAPGESVTFQFVAERSGQFVIELHTQEATAGTELGVFTVHEP
jgi:hypothetical protein